MVTHFKLLGLLPRNMFGIAADPSTQLSKSQSHSHSQSQPAASSLKSHNSVRQSKSKYRHTTLAPFRDDTRLVALRYDQTVALEPPIPLPPPRSPLRPSPRPTSSYIPTQSTHSHSSTIAPPSVPPPRPPPPAQQHPALRTISSPKTFPFHSDNRRDSVHASTASSLSYSHYGTDSDEDDDPFAYEKIDAVSAVRPLQLKAPSVGSSKYSLYDPTRDFDQEQVQSQPQSSNHSSKSGSQSQIQIQSQSQSQHQLQEGATEVRVSEADSRPSVLSSSPGLSESSTTSPSSPASPASPATPPPQFTKRFARTFSLRSGSFRSSPSSSMKRLRKKSQATDAETGAGGGAGTEMGKGKGTKAGSGGNGPKNAIIPSSSNDYSHSHSSASSVYSSPLPLTHAPKETNPIHTTNYTPNNNTPNSPSNPINNVGPSSPTISTNIPCESFFEEDDLSKLSFSIRGSLIFGGKRPWKKSGSISSGSHKMADEDILSEHSTHNTNKTRAFPLVPTATKKDHANSAPTSAPARPPRKDDMGVADIIQKPFQLPELPQHHRQPLLHDSDLVIDSASTTHKLNPSIRVISAEAEKESQKVRSLYEPGEGLDRDMPWPHGGTLEPPLEVPSDVDGNDAYGFLDYPTSFVIDRANC